MKILKSAIVAFSLALSMGAVSNTAVAAEGCEDNRECYGPVAAVNMTVKAVIAARQALDSGEDAKTVSSLIKEASRKNKEINANDIVDRKRQKANEFLRKARKEIKKADLQAAGEHLKEAQNRFEALKAMI